MPVLRILHLAGSACDDFLCEISRKYAQWSLDDAADPSLYDFRVAYVTPDGQWRFPRSFKHEDIAVAKPMSLIDAIQFITTQNIDLMVPQMFCIPGMTHYRALFDLLKIPYLGNTPTVMALTAHKAKAKAVVAAAGVKVPFGEVLRQGDVPTITPPAIVKPADADNSVGVSLVKVATDYDAALKEAFKHSDEVIVEEFIEPGREVRCCIIVKDGKLIDLPLEEYLVNSDKRPIRSHADKFAFMLIENVHLTEEHKERIPWTVNVNDPITQKVQQVARKCHLALGCRHYSLFDFRIDPNGEPWFLEAGLYTIFAEDDVIPHAAKAVGISLNEFFKIAINEALKQ